MKETDIQVGLPDFAEPTLLLLGSASSFRLLANQIRHQEEVAVGAKGPIGRQARLQIVPASDFSEMSRTENSFKVRLSPADAEQIARQLIELANSQKPAHAYIDILTSDSETQIIASLGEYVAEVVFAD
jgi:phosphotransferase system HPr-like phosphotransfer protein